MEIKVKKEKEPELKLKKEAQVTVHKKNPILSAKEKKAAFTSKPVADLLGQRKKKEGAEKGKQPEQGREALFEKQKEKKKQAGKEAVIRGVAEDRKQNGKTKSTVSVPGTLQMDQMKQGTAPNSQPSAGFRAKEQYRREQAAKLAETKKSSLAKQTAIKGVRRGEAAILTQLEGGEEVNDSLYVMGTATTPAEKLWKDRNYRKAEQELKVKQADGKITNKQFYRETKAVKKKQMEKQKKQAVRQRKIQYMINKLTGNGQQDSLAQVAKDIVKMKASVFMLKVIQFAGALLAPLFSILLVVAIPVVIIFFLLYCSPLGAFMPNPSEENPTVREVLSGYYMDFNTKLGQNGEDGAVTYLHEKNGNYVSNYYDTLMVYMVKYGTGDIGVDMDQRHKDKLKEIFDEMNSFENTTITTTIKAGESLGNVVTSGYCQCSICCGQWAGGPTASGVMPKPDHTLAVDAYDPFVPIGTKVVMNGVEYTVEDTGAFARYGVQFDVYYDSHAAASAHGHQTWECYLADDNGSNEVEVTRTRDVDVLNVTLNSGNLMLICQDRLGFFQKELFSAYNDTKGNLQMFATPVDFNWYSSVTSYYGYRIHPISGANQLHNGMDIGAPEGTKVMAGLTGTVTTSAYNDSYGNYVVIKDSKGYELRYAHLSSRSVSAGASVTKGDEIGLVGNTGNSTGSHLHIELLKNGERLNPIFYLETGEGAGFGGNEYTSEAAQRLLNEAARYLGTPYVWGGYSPSGFDCSGFVSYCLTNSGVRNTGRLTAQGLYNICTPVSQSEAQPGDLIFFTGTYDAGEPVTHIGIYVGNGQMIHCGHPVQYTSINSPYWQSHFYGFGRW